MPSEEPSGPAPAPGSEPASGEASDTDRSASTEDRERSEHLAQMRRAVALESDGQRALLEGSVDAGHAKLRAASEAYRASWEAAPPAALGRLVGMLKAAIISGPEAGREAAVYTRAELGAPESATGSYLAALDALTTGEDAEVCAAAEGMRAGGDSFARTADALCALAERDGERYAAALRAIVADFEARGAHLTGVAIADTALMLEALAEPRGLASHPASPLLPA
jgi:hypothetical protein